MKLRVLVSLWEIHVRAQLFLAVALAISLCSVAVPAADKLTAIHSSQSMSQSMPWIAKEAGLFKKYNLDFDLVHIASSPTVTAAMLGGNAEVALTGGEGIIRAYVQGTADFVFIGGVKNILAHSLLAKPEIKRMEDLKGKRIGINRIGSNPHYFTVQVLRQAGVDTRDVQFIQAGGPLETMAALVAGNLDAAALAPPADARAVAAGFPMLIYGPELRLPYVAAAFVSRRPILGQRPQVIGQFMRVMAEAAKIQHTDKEFVYKVLGKYLRLTDRRILDSSYDSEIKFLEPRLEIKPDGIQAILEEVAKVDPRAKQVKAEELIDRRYLDELHKSGLFAKLWDGKK